LGREVHGQWEEIEIVVSIKRDDVDLVGASDSIIGSNSQVDDQVQPQSEAENGEVKGEEEVQEEEKKAATG